MGVAVKVGLAEAVSVAVGVLVAVEVWVGVALGVLVRVGVEGVVCGGIGGLLEQPLKKTTITIIKIAIKNSHIKHSGNCFRAFSNKFCRKNICMY